MLAWSSIEVFRYPFYALRVFKVDIYPITWARYTLFYPLYPLGGFSEAMVLLTASNEFAKTKRFSYALPNRFNIAFDMTVVIKLYSCVVLHAMIIYLMRYMAQQRYKQLKRKEKTA